MAELFGMVVGYYLVYALFAAIFKHKWGLIVSGTLCFLSGVGNYVAFLNGNNLIATIIGVILVVSIKPIQIRNGKKDSEKNEDETEEVEPIVDQEDLTEVKRLFEQIESGIIANANDEEDCGQHDEQRSDDDDE
ncbi:MAG: hypothetical protein IJS67_01735 [Clostridia bacterium]|nr:hypothetical protein [Clostridia bacterium]